MIAVLDTYVGRIPIVLTHLELDEADSRRIAIVHEPHLEVLEAKTGSRFAASCSNDPQVLDLQLVGLLEPFQLRIIFGDERGMIEHLLEPTLEGLQAAEVDDPVALVKTLSFERGFEFEVIAVIDVAMRISSPLSERS